MISGIWKNKPQTQNSGKERKCRADDQNQMLETPETIWSTGRLSHCAGRKREFVGSQCTDCIQTCKEPHRDLWYDDTYDQSIIRRKMRTMKFTLLRNVINWTRCSKRVFVSGVPVQQSCRLTGGFGGENAKWTDKALTRWRDNGHITFDIPMTI